MFQVNHITVVTQVLKAQKHYNLLLFITTLNMPTLDHICRKSSGNCYKQLLTGFHMKCNTGLK